MKRASAMAPVFLLILALLFSVGALVAYDGLTRESPELRERRTGLVARTSARLRLFLRVRMFFRVSNRFLFQRAYDFYAVCLYCLMNLD